MSAQAPSHSNPLIEDGMRLMRHCPLCQQEYEYQHIDHIDEDAGAHLIHVTCVQCSAHMLAIIMMTGFGMSSVGMITDLGAEDVRRLQCAVPLTSDDILGLYEALHTQYTLEGIVVQS